MDSEVSKVLDLERELQTPECRRDPRRVAELLATDFREIGATGRVWDRESILDLLAVDDGDVIEVQSLVGRVLADGVVLALWTSRQGARVALRSSVWRRTGSRWELVYHQGTTVAQD